MEYSPAQIKAAKARSDAGPAALVYIIELEDRLKKIQEVCAVWLEEDRKETNAQIAKIESRLAFCNRYTTKTPSPGLRRYRSELQQELQALQEAQKTQQEIAYVLQLI